MTTAPRGCKRPDCCLLLHRTVSGVRLAVGMTSSAATHQRHRDQSVPVTVRDGDLSPEMLAAAIQSGLVACDTETTGLDPVSDSLRVVQVHVPGWGTEVVRVNAEGGDYLRGLLTNSSVVKIFHHATFDLAFLQKRLGLIAENVACTKVASKLLWPGENARQRLTALARHYLTIELDKSQQLSDWSADVLSDEQVAYAAGDVHYLAALLEELSKDLVKAGLMQLAEKCWSHLPVRAELNNRGYGDVFAY